MNSARCRTLHKHTTFIRNCAFSPGNRILASATFDGNVYLWNAQTGKCLQTLDDHIDDVLCVAFSPDGKTLASGSQDKTVRLWNVDNGKCKQACKFNFVVSCIAFSPNNDCLAFGASSVIHLWKFVSNAVKMITDHLEHITSVAFSPDGVFLASASLNRSIRVWRVETGNCVCRYNGHINFVSSVAFFPGNCLLVSGSADKTLHIWSLETASCISMLGPCSDWVSRVAISPNGKILASCCLDKTISVWNAENGQLVHVFYLENNCACSVAFSQTGKALARTSKCTLQILSLLDYEALCRASLLLRCGVAPYVVLDVVNFLQSSPSFNAASAHMHAEKIFFILFECRLLSGRKV